MKRWCGMNPSRSFPMGPWSGTTSDTNRCLLLNSHHIYIPCPYNIYIAYMFKWLEEKFNSLEPKARTSSTTSTGTSGTRRGTFQLFSINNPFQQRFNFRLRRLQKFTKYEIVVQVTSSSSTSPPSSLLLLSSSSSPPPSSYSFAFRLWMPTGRAHSLTLW